MRALSIRQPWAELILHHGKDVENRTWETRFRGRVLVHTGKKPDCSMGELREEYPQCIATLGCLVGSVQIIGCDKTNTGNRWEMEGQFHFRLANPVAFKMPIPFVGALGFFDVPDNKFASITGCVDCGEEIIRPAMVEALWNERAQLIADAMEGE